VSIILTSRSKDLPHGLRYTNADVPALDALTAHETFTQIYGADISDSLSTLQELLTTVGYHPLTTTLRTHVAELNFWTS
jgi:hypothetical protein